MLLAQAFAEYLDFVECVSGGQPQCRMDRTTRKPIVPCQAAMVPWVSLRSACRYELRYSRASFSAGAQRRITKWRYRYDQTETHRPRHLRDAGLGKGHRVLRGVHGVDRGRTR